MAGQALGLAAIVVLACRSSTAQRDFSLRANVVTALPALATFSPCDFRRLGGEIDLGGAFADGDDELGGGRSVETFPW